MAPMFPPPSLGSGDATGMGRGVAPAAQLVFQAVEDYVEWYSQCAEGPDGYYLIGIPAYLSTLLQASLHPGRGCMPIHGEAVPLAITRSTARPQMR